MHGSLNAAAPFVQAENGTDLLIAGGESLTDAIARHARAGRPAWRINSLYVPRIPYRAGSRPKMLVPIPVIGIPTDVRAGINERRLYDTVSASLAQRPPWPHEWRAHEQAQLRALYVAAWADLRGIKHDPMDLRGETTIDRDRRNGRELWASIGAFPWALFGPAGQVPLEWRADELVRTAWEHWLED